MTSRIPAAGARPKLGGHGWRTPMHALARLLLWFGIWVLGTTALAPAQAQPQRAVAVLYDDSGSMQKPPTRWIGANFSLQVLSALLGEGDELFVATMDRPASVKSMSVPADVDGWLRALQRQPLPNHSTPYDGVGVLLAALKRSAATERWLLVVTDGEFDGGTVNDALLREQIDQVVKPLGIRSAFVIIESPGAYAVQEYWRKEAGATVFRVDRASQLPARMEELAALLTGRDSSGLTTKVAGNELRVSSKFPLRNVVVLAQGVEGVRVNAAVAGSRPMQARSHDVRQVQPNADVPVAANVSHLSVSGGIDSGDEVARITFSGPLDKARLKVLADVAARMDVQVLDRSGKAIAPDAQGRYPVCAGEEAGLVTRLTATNGAALTQGRTDLAQFSVGFDVDSSPKPLTSTIAAGQTDFVAKAKPSATMAVRPFARYPGYFNFSSRPLVLLPVQCSRKVEMRLLTTLGSDKQWSAEIDALAKAEPLRFGAFVEGRPATEAEVAGWTWTSQAGSTWTFSREGAQVVLRPRTACCALTWWRPKAHQGTIQLTQLQTGNDRDVIQMPPAVTYAFVLPGSTWRRLWWLYGCPLAAWLGAAALAWYLWRLLVVKQRFGRRAVMHIERNNRRWREPMCRSGELLKRWLWPSLRDEKVIEGVRFRAVGRGGAAVIADGRTLTQWHEVDEWMFDEGRAERRMPQPDARLRHQLNIVRRTAHNQRPGAFEVRMQYSRDGSAAVWPQ